jgi:hypothetical protein
MRWRRSESGFGWQLAVCQCRTIPTKMPAPLLPIFAAAAAIRRAFMEAPR